MKGPLDIAFVWHMHQPYYKISDTGAFEMPWVRLHGLKDYADMVELTAGYAALHQTFNLVPSLVEQLRDYVGGDYLDTYREHALKPAAELTPAERSFLLEVMCERATHPRARGNPRYLELARKRDRCTVHGTVRVEEFTEAEILDLQVWFDLAWFDARHLRAAGLDDLAARGRDFAESDKARIAAAEAGLLARVLPAYRRAAESGAVELTTSPYFHPILPLLVNSDLARVSMPGVELPTRRFAHPEDAREHVRLALDSHARNFGRHPRGMWCSEQSVGEDVVGLLAGEGLAWTISDESVLDRSLESRSRQRGQGGRDDPRSLYSAYRLEREEGTLDIVFRDRELSDLIGFTYQEWDPGDAAGDFLHRLRAVRDGLPDGGRGHLVTVALDGENAWEYYREGGRDFLERLYEGLAAEPSFRCVTVSGHLADHPPTRRLPWLHTGSWIGGDFGTWIGDRAHRRAWDLLHDARDAVAAERSAAKESHGIGETRVEPTREADGPPVAAAVTEDVERAWREILIAEGSDWLWWFSDHQESGLDHIWDAAFRRHLQQAYRLAGLAPPATLFAPVLPGAAAPGDGLLTPSLDGLLDPPDEWRRGVVLRPAAAGTMQRSTTLPLNALRFGWDRAGLYFLAVPEAGAVGQVEVVFHLGAEGPDDESGALAGGGTAAAVPPPATARETPEITALADLLGFRPVWRLVLTLTLGAESVPAAADAAAAGTAQGAAVAATGSWEPPAAPRDTPRGSVGAAREASEPLTVAADRVVEASLPWAALGDTAPRRLFVGAEIFRAGVRIETFPSGGALPAHPPAD